jgi:flagellar hook-associated protein 1 FlgK
MGLTSALYVGRSGLSAAQTAIEVTGQNLANVGTPGYHRQTVSLTPAGDSKIGQGMFIGRGVRVQEITRNINQALEGRVRDSIADEQAATIRRDILAQIEAIEGELTSGSVSNQLFEFFNGWSELANNPLDNSVRTLVTQQGNALSDFIRSVRSELGDLRVQVDDRIDLAARNVDDLLTEIANVQRTISTVEGGTPGAHSLRDQRDALISELSQYLDISVNEHDDGQLDIFVGSLPIILNGRSRGLEVSRRTVDGQLVIDVRTKADGSVLEPSTGELGALIATRQKDVLAAIDTLDRFTNQLIYQVNKVHSQGQGLQGFSSVTGTTRVWDAEASLGSDAAGLAFAPKHGSFEINVVQKSTGAKQTYVVNIDLDGIDAANDTSLNGIVAQLGGIDNLSASVNPAGQLRIDAVGADYELTFSNDSSGVLAALGVNTFFAGSSAADMAMNDRVLQNPSLLAAGLGHVSGDNRNALAVAALREQPLADLNGLSVVEVWNRHVEDYAVRLGQTVQDVQSKGVVRSSLEAQQQAVSGVNADEEAINLLTYQRAYQGSAKFLSVVDELMQTLLSLL